MTIKNIPTDQLDPNPWQTRLDEDPTHVQTLAADIAARGLLQVPAGRPHPTDPGRVQLAFGHSRLAAWKIAKPDDPFPLDVRELADRDMAEYAIAENAKRQDLSAIEKARALTRYMDDFRVPQAEAGRLFDIGQAAVSNLLRLLKLPEPVQLLVHQDALPERLARQLLPIARLAPKRACDIAAQVAAADDRERTCEHLVEQALNDLAQPLGHAPWDMAWPEQSMSADIARPDKGEPRQLSACAGCAFAVQHDHRTWCTRPACYGLKRRVFAGHELQRLAEKLRLPIAAPGEQVELFYTGEWNARDPDRVEKTLATRHPSLRLVPIADDADGAYSRQAQLGSRCVALATTDPAALKKALAAAPAPKKRGEDDPHYKEMAARRKRAGETKRLIAAAAPYFAPAMPDNPTLLDLIFNKLKYEWPAGHSKIEAEWKKADAQEHQRILAQLLLYNHVGISAYSAPVPATVAKKLLDLAGRLTINLPSGWDAPQAKPVAKKKAR